jgi:hypothetical protein
MKVGRKKVRSKYENNVNANSITTIYRCTGQMNLVTTDVGLGENGYAHNTQRQMPITIVVAIQI